MISYKKKNIINSYIFGCVIIIGLLFLFRNQYFSSISSQVIFTFFINGILVFFHMLKSSKLGYSLIDMFDIFMLFFMFVAPILQYLNNGFPWENSHFITNEIILRSNLIIFIFLAVFYSIYNIHNKKNVSARINNFSKNNFFIHTKIILELGFYISTLVTVFIIYQTGFTNLFSRSTNTLGYENRSINLIINNFLRAFPLVVLLINIKFKKKSKSYFKRWQYYLLLIFTVITHFPTGLARYRVAVVYLAIFLTLKEKFNNKFFFKLTVILGLLIIFPLINIFRRNTFQDLVNLSINFPNVFETFIHGDFDAYSMLSRSLIFINQNTFSLGRQLLGSLLFFVPRPLWPTKPIGSGQMVAENLGFNYTNISMPFVAEGYINFGIAGVVIFAVVMAIIIKKLDVNYQEVILKDSRQRISFIEILYPSLLGYLFFMLRGDLMTSFAYTVGYSMPAILLIILDKIIKLFKSKNKYNV